MLAALLGHCAYTPKLLPEATGACLFSVQGCVQGSGRQSSTHSGHTELHRSLVSPVLLLHAAWQHHPAAELQHLAAARPMQQAKGLLCLDSACRTRKGPSCSFYHRPQHFCCCYCGFKPVAEHSLLHVLMSTCLSRWRVSAVIRSCCTAHLNTQALQLPHSGLVHKWQYNHPTSSVSLHRFLARRANHSVCLSSTAAARHRCHNAALPSQSICTADFPSSPSHLHCTGTP